MTIKTREPGSAFLKQVETFVPKTKKRRPWRELGTNDEGNVTGIPELQNNTPETLIDTAFETKLTPEVTRHRTAHRTAHETDIGQHRTAHETAFLDSDSQHRTAHRTEDDIQSETHRTAHRTARETSFNILALTQTEEKILHFLLDSCAFTGQRSSEKIKARVFAEEIAVTLAALRKSVQRMRAKEWLDASDVSHGNQGGTVYTLRHDVWNALNLRRASHRVAAESHIGEHRTAHETDIGQHRTAHETAHRTAHRTEPSSSSSSLINNNSFNATTTEPELELLPAEWRHIDYLALTEQGCPFGSKQIRQARSFGMTPEALQESIFNFAWALSQKWEPEGRFQTSPLNFFMGCLKRNGLYEHEGYYRQLRMRQELEKQWLDHREKKESFTLNEHEKLDRTIEGASEVFDFPIIDAADAIDENVISKTKIDTSI